MRTDCSDLLEAAHSLAELLSIPIVVAGGDARERKLSERSETKSIPENALLMRVSNIALLELGNGAEFLKAMMME